jgi:hypothetical protein
LIVLIILGEEHKLWRSSLREERYFICSVALRSSNDAFSNYFLSSRCADLQISSKLFECSQTHWYSKETFLLRMRPVCCSWW